MDELEARIAKIEKWMRTSKILGMTKTIIYVILILGAAIYLYNLSSSIEEWRIEVAGIPEVYPAGITEIEVRIPISIYNPSDRVMGKLIYYRIYVDGYYTGDGFIPYLYVPQGWSNHTLTFRIDLTRIGCGLASTLSKGNNVTVSIQGYAMVDLYILGKIPWRTYTIAFNETVGPVAVPDLGDTGRSVLGALNVICSGIPSLGGDDKGGIIEGLPIPIP